MVFERILGQPTAVETLRHALARGRVHHAYRFEGPDGVGKEMAALALAQSLLCTEARDAAQGEGCGQCSACRRVVSWNEHPPQVPKHPDVLLVARGLYPAEVVSAREATGISVEQIRNVVLSRSAYPPHEGRALICIVRDADELSLSAANALLKTLEEPRTDLHFILLTSRPNRLLDTVRSRTLAVRFAPLPDALLEKLLEEHGLRSEAVPFAQGSARAAIELAEPAQLDELQQWLQSMESAIGSGDLSLGLQLAADLSKDRRVVQAQLRAFAQHLASQARAVVGEDEARAVHFANRHAAVGRALDALERNVSPTLAVEALFAECRNA